MATVNIRRDVDDKFYRYKMPALQTKIEGKGNGIKTVIPNMDEIGKALNRPATYPTKFFGCELGAQTTMASDRYIINGRIDADRLRELLDVFIEKFVLCPSCKNPETNLIIQVKQEEITRDCKACGAQTGVDMRHKLTTYILKNPPVGTTSGKGSKGKKGKAEATVKKDKYADVEEMREQQLAGNVPTLGELPSGSGFSSSNANNGGGSSSPTSDLPTPIGVGPGQTSLADQDWSVDTSAEAVAARMKNLAVNVDGFSGGLGGDEDGAGDSKYAAFGSWLEEMKLSSDGMTDADIVGKAKELEVWGKYKSCVELGEKMWVGATGEEIVKEIEKREKILKAFTNSEKAQKALLGGFERLVGLSNPSLLPTLPKLLMQLYQSDILEEEVLLHWGTHASKKYTDKDVGKKLRKSSEPFLKWLEEASDDDEEEEESGDGEEEEEEGEESE